MEQKLKVYVISVMAFMSTEDALELSFLTGAEGDISTCIEQLPGIVPASSISEAAEQTKTFALDRWKPSEGWYGHQAAILPVTKNFYEAAFTAYKAGVVDTFDETEQGECFTF